jgi:NSS family neurotransmitter:Na+ symporter
VAFAQMPGGYLFSILFFLMLTVAGITSMVGLVESVNYWVEERYGLPRHKSALLVIGSIAVLSVFSSLSYNMIGELTIGGNNFNDILDYFSTKMLLPLGGLLIAVFAGWAVNKAASRDELTSLNAVTYEIWHFLIRFVVPPALLVILVVGVTG